jgi:L-threonylcarbamoyladenylate synthase
MKNTYSNIFLFSKKIVYKITQVLNKGGMVGLPTETVYGLAGNAYSRIPIAKIFKLKGRPKLNPLIVHYYDIRQALNDVEINNNFIKLYKKFCP